MGVKFSNNGHSTLASSLSSSGTSITVASGHGSRFPSLSSGEYFYATLIDSSNNLEIVKVTARSSDVLTATRAQESTTARAFAIGDRIELRVTAQGLADHIDLDNVVADDSITAAKINVSGNGTSGQALLSDGDGSFSFGSSFDELTDVGIWLDPAGGEGPAGPSSTGISERYGNQTIFNSSNLNMRQTANGNQVITIQEAGDYFIKCAGAQGGGYQGGLGGHSWGTVTLSANDVLYCRVGQAGLMGGQDATSTTPTTSPEDTIFHEDISGNDNKGGGGFGDGKGGDGGGAGSGNTNSGGGGTSIRLNTDSSANRIIVAGGGGGGYLEGQRFASGTTSPPGGGGHGGGAKGLPPDKVSEGSAARTRGGTQSAGGTAGSGGNAGQSPSAGGAGGNGPTNDGGGGGGGYAGGSSATNAAGGGGSGYVGGMNAANRGMQAGCQAGSGWIYIRKVG